MECSYPMCKDVARAEIERLTRERDEALKERDEWKAHAEKLPRRALVCVFSDVFDERQAALKAALRDVAMRQREACSRASPCSKAECFSWIGNCNAILATPLVTGDGE